MQFLLSQTEYNELKNAQEPKEPEHSTVFAADFEQMLRKSRIETFRSVEHLGAEAINMQVQLDDIPPQLRQLIERHIRTR